MNCSTYRNTHTGKKALIETWHDTRQLSQSPPPGESSHVKTVSKLQLVPILRRNEQTLLSSSPRQAGNSGTEQPSHEEVCERCDGQRQEQEMYEDVEERESHDAGGVVGGCDAPGKTGEEHEKR